MARTVNQIASKKAQRTKPIPVEELMFAFRTINSQGGTKNFLSKCADRGYSIRVTSDFFDFVLEEAMEATSSVPPTLTSANFAAAVKLKDWNDCRRKKKTFFA